MNVRWMQRAACKGLDTDLFFPDTGVNHARLKKLCAACPVRQQCLQYAVENGMDDGLWGGLSPRQRRPLRKKYNANQTKGA